ncbi:MAG TPA: HTTM domain-containing protein [Pirellulales bacterium]|nr:HTTM domain-containing protein [Pirellulales bacterium]
MTTTPSPLGNWFRQVAAGWDRFWFTPTDPATLALIRILAGGMLFYTHLIWGVALSEFFGDHGWLNPHAVGLILKDSYKWSYLWWFHTPTSLAVVHGAAMIVFFLLTIGLFSRTMSVLAFIATASYAGRGVGSQFGLDQINLLLSMYLMVGPSGAAYSIDRLLKARRAGGPLPPAPPSTAANIALRLMQLHLCIIYLYAGMGKLMGPAWWNGTAMWQAVASLEYQSIDMTWLANYPMLLDLLTHVTVLWELFYIALIWPRVTRPVMLVLAVPLHLGIAFCLGMVTFGTVMLIANLAFVPAPVVRGFLQWCESKLWGTAPREARAATVAAAPAGRRDERSSRRSKTKRRPGAGAA